MSPPLSVNPPEMARALLKNASSHGWVVQKFGGTSVGKFPDRIAEDIVRYVKKFCCSNGVACELTACTRRSYVENNRLVVVCSARSTGKKTTGTTSR